MSGPSDAFISGGWPILNADGSFSQPSTNQPVTFTSGGVPLPATPIAPPPQAPSPAPSPGPIAPPPSNPAPPVNPDAWKDLNPPPLPAVPTIAPTTPAPFVSTPGLDAGLQQLAGAGAPKKDLFSIGQPVAPPAQAAPPIGTRTGEGPTGPVAPPPSPAGPSMTGGQSVAPHGGGSSQIPKGQEPLPSDVQFKQVGGGSVPAREVPIRGPKQNSFLEHAYEEPLKAADRIEDRSVRQADLEAEEFQHQADAASERQVALGKLTQQRTDQLTALQSDFQNTVGELGKMKIDNDRMFHNASTPARIGSKIMVFLGGVFQHGGHNAVLDDLNKRIDQDISAQKFDYDKGLDQAKGQQTAYGMAMQRYQSEDAANAAARAAALDYALARTDVLRANWKGVNEQNRADELRAKLMAERDQMIASGLKYLQPTSVAPKYVMSVRGQQLPGTVTEQRAQDIAVKHGVEPAERTDDILTKGGVELSIKDKENATKKDNEANEGAKDVAHELQRAGVPKMRAMAEQALSSLRESPGSTSEALVRGGLSKGGEVGDAAANKIYGDKNNAREQRWQNFVNQDFHELSGAAISRPEEARLKRGLGSSDPKSKERALRDLLTTLDVIEENSLAGASPKAQAQFKKNQSVAQPGKPVAPEGASKGWQ